MPRMPERSEPADIEEIAEMADRGEDISRFFTNSGHMMQPLSTQSVKVDFTRDMLQELDRAARELGVSRQAIIKNLLRQSLDQHYLALSHQQRRKAVRSSATAKAATATS